MKKSAPKVVYPALAFSLVCSITALVVLMAYWMQRHYSEVIFNNLAQRQAQTLSSLVETDLEFIGAGANFFHAVPPESWQQFSYFADGIVSSSGSVIAMQWMQKVDAQDVEIHMTNMQSRLPNSELFTIPKGGSRTTGNVLSNERPLFIASDVFPRTESNLSVLGFYSSRVRFQRILDGMRENRQPHISDKLRLLQDGPNQTEPRNGILIYHPVFDRHAVHELIGVVIGVVRADEYFSSLIERTASENTLEIRVTDLGYEAYDDPILFSSQGWDSYTGFHASERISLPNRDWLIEFKLPTTFTDYHKWTLKGLGMGGILIALLVAYIVYMQIEEKNRLSRMLANRTKELQFLADHDSLTELYSRRAFNHFVDKFILHRKQFSLVVFDIDFFKSVNDNYGHVAGDQMLVHISSVVKSKLYSDDVFVRLGGDEFCIITTIVNKQALENYLESIRIAVVDTPTIIEGQHISCSLSIGAAVRNKQSKKELLKEADAQLYLSKEQGRNSVNIAA